jgi:hypothetical protein
MWYARALTNIEGLLVRWTDLWCCNSSTTANSVSFTISVSHQLLRHLHLSYLSFSLLSPPIQEDSWDGAGAGGEIGISVF